MINHKVLYRFTAYPHYCLKCHKNFMSLKKENECPYCLSGVEWICQPKPNGQTPTSQQTNSCGEPTTPTASLFPAGRAEQDSTIHSASITSGVGG